MNVENEDDERVTLTTDGSLLVYETSPNNDTTPTPIPTTTTTSPTTTEEESFSSHPPQQEKQPLDASSRNDQLLKRLEEALVANRQLLVQRDPSPTTTKADTNHTEEDHLLSTQEKFQQQEKEILELKQEIRFLKEKKSMDTTRSNSNNEKDGIIHDPTTCKEDDKDHESVDGDKDNVDTDHQSAGENKTSRSSEEKRSVEYEEEERENRRPPPPKTQNDATTIQIQNQKNEIVVLETKKRQTLKKLQTLSQTLQKKNKKKMKQEHYYYQKLYQELERKHREQTKEVHVWIQEMEHQLQFEHELLETIVQQQQQTTTTTNPWKQEKKQWILLHNEKIKRQNRKIESLNAKLKRQQENYTNLVSQVTTWIQNHNRTTTTSTASVEGTTTDAVDTTTAATNHDMALLVSVVEEYKKQLNHANIQLQNAEVRNQELVEVLQTYKEKESPDYDDDDGQPSLREEEKRDTNHPKDDNATVPLGSPKTIQDFTVEEMNHYLLELQKQFEYQKKCILSLEHTTTTAATRMDTNHQGETNIIHHLMQQLKEKEQQMNQFQEQIQQLLSKATTTTIHPQPQQQPQILSTEKGMETEPSSSPTPTRTSSTTTTSGSKDIHKEGPKLEDLVKRIEEQQAVIEMQKESIVSLEKEKNDKDFLLLLATKKMQQNQQPQPQKYPYNNTPNSSNRIHTKHNPSNTEEGELVVLSNQQDEIKEIENQIVHQKRIKALLESKYQMELKMSLDRNHQFETVFLRKNKERKNQHSNIQAQGHNQAVLQREGHTNEQKSAKDEETEKDNKRLLLSIKEKRMKMLINRKEQIGKANDNIEKLKQKLTEKKENHHSFLFQQQQQQEGGQQQQEGELQQEGEQNRQQPGSSKDEYNTNENSEYNSGYGSGSSGSSGRSSISSGSMNHVQELESKIKNLKIELLEETKKLEDEMNKNEYLNKQLDWYTQEMIIVNKKLKQLENKNNINQSVSFNTDIRSEKDLEIKKLYNHIAMQNKLINEYSKKDEGKENQLALQQNQKTIQDDHDNYNDNHTQQILKQQYDAVVVKLEETETELQDLNMKCGIEIMNNKHLTEQLNNYSKEMAVALKRVEELEEERQQLINRDTLSESNKIDNSELSEIKKSEIQATHLLETGDGFDKQNDELSKKLNDEKRTIKDLAQKLEKKENELKQQQRNSKKEIENEIEKIKAEHQKEIGEILEQLDVVENENKQRLKEKIKLLEEKDAIILSSVRAKRQALEESTRLKEQVGKLTTTLQLLENNHKKAIELERTKIDEACEKARHDMVRQAEIRFKQANDLYVKLQKDYESSLLKIQKLEEQLLNKNQ